jgi:hypothetical protein
MSRDEDWQSALTYVSDAAERLHQVRALERELVDLVGVATRSAVALGVPGQLVAKAAGVTPGRVSQIVAAPGEADAGDWRARVWEVTESPADALRRHWGGFAGVMTYPPYERRRSSVGVEPRRGYTDGFPYAAPVSLEQLRGPVSGVVRVPAHIDPRPDPVFNLEVESSLLEMYGAVVRAGTISDQCELLDAELLRHAWPTLVLPAPSRRLWHSRIPELASL